MRTDWTAEQIVAKLDETIKTYKAKADKGYDIRIPGTLDEWKYNYCVYKILQMFAEFIECEVE